VPAQGCSWRHDGAAITKGCRISSIRYGCERFLGGGHAGASCRNGCCDLFRVIGRMRPRTRWRCGFGRSVWSGHPRTCRSRRRSSHRLYGWACDRPIVGATTVRTESPSATVNTICGIKRRQSSTARRGSRCGCRTGRRRRSKRRDKRGHICKTFCKIGERYAIAYCAGIRVKAEAQSVSGHLRRQGPIESMSGALRVRSAGFCLQPLSRWIPSKLTCNSC
jgi:hypothetical protein